MSGENTSNRDTDKELAERLAAAGILRWPDPPAIDPQSTGNPIFELFNSEWHIKIYANGWIEGAPKGTGIANLIGVAIKPEWERYFSKPQAASQSPGQ